MSNWKHDIKYDKQGDIIIPSSVKLGSLILAFLFISTILIAIILTPILIVKDNKKWKGKISTIEWCSE